MELYSLGLHTATDLENVTDEDERRN